MTRDETPFKPLTLRRAITADESRALDRHAMEVMGMRGADLMEIAGQGAAAILQGMEGPWTSTRPTVLALCGKGNNGGDAIVTAHHLAKGGVWRPEILLAAPEAEMSEDARRHLRAFKERYPDAMVRGLRDGGEGMPSDADADMAAGEQGRPTTVWDCDVVLDGLLGTGFRGAVREPMASLILSLNKAANEKGGPFVVSMDVPSGLGARDGVAVQAAATITFGCWKTGLLLSDGPDRAGRVHLVKLPFDETVLESRLFLISLEDRSDQGPVPPIRRRPGHRHKYDGGVVHVIGGSPGLSGAPIMGARAAWRKGAGAVILHGAAGLLARFEGLHPEIIGSPAGSPEDLMLDPAHAPAIAETIRSRPGAVLIGPGLGRISAGNGVVGALLSRIRDLDAARAVPIVLDADALRSAGTDLFTRHPDGPPVVLTPHPGELASLLGLEPGAPLDDAARLDLARDLALRTGCHICSKGSPTIACAPDGTTVITAYNTSPFHRTGFGDVLAGQIAANLSFGADPMHAILDALLHGLHRATHWASETPFSPEDAC